jgi:hypothetical protein
MVWFALRLICSTFCLRRFIRFPSLPDCSYDCEHQGNAENYPDFNPVSFEWLVEIGCHQVTGDAAYKRERRNDSGDEPREARAVWSSG